MKTVIRLFDGKNLKSVPSGPEGRVATEATIFLASSSKLDDAVKELSVRLDAFEHIIDGIDDTEIRNPLKHKAKLSRDALSGSLLKLSQEVRKLLKVGNAGSLETQSITSEGASR